MKSVLVISSFVSASHVGARVSAFCLSRLGHTPVILPTTLLGRHPGWGPPGGGPVDIQMLNSVWQGISDQNISFDAVLTGYMAAAEQVPLVADIIDGLKIQNKDLVTLVDPVMGDHGRLYVSEEIAKSIKNVLVPRADIITPNLFEFGWLDGFEYSSETAIINAVKKRSQKVLVSSMSDETLTGALYGADTGIAKVMHPKLDTVPNGSGDALAATFLAHILSGDRETDALQRAVSSVYAMLKLSFDENRAELPLIDAQRRLMDAQLLPLSLDS